MRPGRMNERITVQSQSTSPDGAGGTTNTWGDVKTVWADVTPKEVNRVLEDGREYHATHYEVVVRKDAVGIDNIGDYRIKWGSKNLRIHNLVNVDQEDNWTKLICADG